MANEDGESTAQVINGQDEEEAHVVSSSAASAAADGVKLLSDAVRKLPPQALKDLLSIRVCMRCIFRLFGLRECVYCSTSLTPSVFGALLGEIMSLEGQTVDIYFRENQDCSEDRSEELEMEPKFCRICLGILQFAFCDEKGTLVRRDCATDFALLISEMVRQDGHRIDNFSLEVSLPPSITENEEAVWLYMKSKYESEPWFRKLSLPERISAKDVLKLSITNPLEKLLGVVSCSSSFRIRLTYTHSEASIKVTDFTERNGCNKRRKTGVDEDSSTISGSVISNAEHSDISASEECISESSRNGSQNHYLPDCRKPHLEKVKQPCSLALICHRTPIYIAGRYLKYSRNVSQSRWIIDDERMGEASVEELISSNVLPMCQGDNYKFHAAGREDIDVRMLGSGRPFLVEIQNARQIPSDMFVKEIEGKINRLENKLVKVKNLKVVDSQGWALMREGESEKQKQYAALVWISRSLEDDDVKTISSLKDMPILQRTPVRVLHRRSPLEREKIIHWMEVERISGSSQYFLLHLCTQAGTYIKEFVHGDLGRTHPSIGTILGCRAEILQLDVTNVKMDCFLDE